MGEVKTLTGFTVMPRVKIPGGMVNGCEFYTSLDGENWTLATKATLKPDPGIAEYESAECSAEFPFVKARYFKPVVTDVLASNHVAIAEIGVVEYLDGAAQ